MYGSRATLLVGFLTAVITTLIGISVGLTSGFIRWSDEPLMRSTDVVLTLPTLPLLIVLAAFIRPTLFTVALIISLLAWPGMARVLRSSVISLRELPFIEVALLSGVPKWKIMFMDLIRHVVPLILAFSLFAVIGGVLTEATLDFIGVGPITDYSWGAMIALAQNGEAAINGAWWWVVIPGLSIAVFCTGIALIGYGLEGIYRKG
jgi:peptide/nickel transport system permease protein